VTFADEMVRFDVFGRVSFSLLGLLAASLGT
jgi:hypothetical protein